MFSSPYRLKKAKGKRQDLTLMIAICFCYEIEVTMIKLNCIATGDVVCAIKIAWQQ